MLDAIVVFDFDEEKHPRDERGRWAESPSESEAERARAHLDWPHATLYHGTGGYEADEIRRAGFRLPTLPVHGGDYGTAVYLTDDAKFASSYGHHVVAVDLDPSARILDLRYGWAAGVFDQHYESVPVATVRETADRLGYVGVTDGDVVAVFDPTVLHVRDNRKGSFAFDESKHPRGGDPANPGRFSPAEGEAVPDAAVAEAVRAWTGNGDPYDLTDAPKHKEITAAADGLSNDPVAQAQAATLIRAIDAAPRNETPLYRGMGLTKSQVADLQQGASIEAGLSSWSSKFGLAKEFADSTGYIGSGKVPVILSITGAHALNIDPMSPPPLRGSGEHLLHGDLHVTAISAQPPDPAAWLYGEPHYWLVETEQRDETTASADFDESKHPRDEHGRFAGDGPEPQTLDDSGLAGFVPRLRGLAGKAQDTGTLDAFKTIHNAARGFEELGNVNDALDLDTVTQRQVDLASRQITERSQEALAKIGAPDLIVAYRQGGRGMDDGVVAVSTRRLDDPVTGYLSGQTEYSVRREDVLTFGEALQHGTFSEHELHVEASKLRDVHGKLTAAGDWDESKHPRGGDPEHPGRFSPAEGGESDTTTTVETRTPIDTSPVQQGAEARAVIRDRFPRAEPKLEVTVSEHEFNALMKGADRVLAQYPNIAKDVKEFVIGPATFGASGSVATMPGGFRVSISPETIRSATLTAIEGIAHDPAYPEEGRFPTTGQIVAQESTPGPGESRATAATDAAFEAVTMHEMYHVVDGHATIEQYLDEKPSGALRPRVMDERFFADRSAFADVARPTAEDYGKVARPSDYGLGKDWGFRPTEFFAESMTVHTLGWKDREPSRMSDMLQRASYTTRMEFNWTPTGFARKQKLATSPEPEVRLGHVVLSHDEHMLDMDSAARHAMLQSISLTASGFDEDKHPRDERGRWTDSGGQEQADGTVAYTEKGISGYLRDKLRVPTWEEAQHRPGETFYRIVSDEDYTRMRAQGYLDTAGKHNQELIEHLGVTGMTVSKGEPEPGYFQDGVPSRAIAIETFHEDEVLSTGRYGAVITERLPFDRVTAVSDVIVRDGSKFVVTPNSAYRHKVTAAGDWDPDKHPRGGDPANPGRFSPAEEDAMVRALREPDGGFTIDPRDGHTPTTGFAVAIPGHESITPTGEFFSNPQHSIEIIDHWLKNNASMWDDPTVMVGGWHDPAHHEIALDPTRVVQDRDEAILLGQQNNQHAIADLAAIHRGDWEHAIIPTGGSGNRKKLSAGTLIADGYSEDTVGDGEAEEAGQRNDRRGTSSVRDGDLRDDERRGEARGLIAALRARLAPFGKADRAERIVAWVRAQEPSVVLADRLIVFDFDESKHPRDEHGRWAEAETRDAVTGIPEGWSYHSESTRDNLVNGLVKAGANRDAAEKEIDSMAHDGAIRQHGPFDEKFNVYEYKGEGGTVSMRFGENARIPGDRQMESLEVVRRLADENPLGQDLRIDVLRPDEMMTTHAYGETFLPGGRNIQISSNAYALGVEKFINKVEGGITSVRSTLRPDVSFAAETLTHEYGHAFMAAHDAAMEDKGNALRHQLARIDTMMETEPPSDYGDIHKQNEYEAYAEAFTQWKHSDHPGPLATKLAKTEGW